ncbi:MAG: hypothetical protein COW70_02535, partial [Hydrogenophilales bacterium CG18_big_fil_WC_8_21_14_2_50_58_12]
MIYIVQSMVQQFILNFSVGAALAAMGSYRGQGRSYGGVAIRVKDTGRFASVRWGRKPRGEVFSNSGMSLKRCRS